MALGPEPIMFLNIPSVIIVFGGAAGMSLVFVGKRKLDWSEILYHYGRFALWSGSIGTLIGIIQMLTNMKDPRSIGPAVAVGLLTALYGIVTYIFCFAFSRGTKVNSEMMKADTLMGVLFIASIGVVGLLVTTLTSTGI